MKKFEKYCVKNFSVENTKNIMLTILVLKIQKNIVFKILVLKIQQI